MTDKRIVHRSDEGGVIIECPSPEALRLVTIEQLAEIVVPEGRPFKIVDITELPSDRVFRNAWEADEADLTDGVGSPYNTFTEYRNADNGS